MYLSMCVFICILYVYVFVLYMILTSTEVKTNSFFYGKLSDAVRNGLYNAFSQKTWCTLS